MVRNGGGRALPELKAHFSARVRVLNKAHLSPGGAGRSMRCSGTGGREPHPVRSNGGMASSQAGVSRSKCRVLGGALGGGRSGRSQGLRWRRILSMTRGVSMRPMIFSARPQRGQIRGSGFVDLLDKPCPKYPNADSGTQHAVNGWCKELRKRQWEFTMNLHQRSQTAMSTNSYTKTRFSANDAALVLIDHQSGIMQLVHDYSPAEFRNNVIALAKLGKVFKLPTVLSTSLGQGPNGPFIPEVVSLFPEVPVIDRPGIISAWDDPKFVAAIQKTGRKNLIMAGLQIDGWLPLVPVAAVQAGGDRCGPVPA